MHVFQAARTWTTGRPPRGKRSAVPPLHGDSSNSVGCSLATRLFVVDTIPLDTTVLSFTQKMGGGWRGFVSLTPVSRLKVATTLISDHFVFKLTHVCLLVALVENHCRALFCFSCFRCEPPNSWIDDRDDTELDVIAAFLETIVDVPVNFSIFSLRRGRLAHVCVHFCSHRRAQSLTPPAPPRTPVPP